MHESEIFIVDAIILWITVVILFLAGIWLFIWSIYIIILNIVLIKKGLPCQKESVNAFINTSIRAGIIALVIGTMFLLIIKFFIYPRYTSGKSDKVELMFFLVPGIVFLIYSIFVFCYNIFKMIRAR